jgi:hypothetical protein
MTFEEIKKLPTSIYEKKKPSSTGGPHLTWRPHRDLSKWREVAMYLHGQYIAMKIFRAEVIYCAHPCLHDQYLLRHSYYCN